MQRNKVSITRNLILTAAAAITAASLTGCYTASKTALNFQPNEVISSEFAVSDSIGAAMFSEHVRVAHAEANYRRLMREDFATANIPKD